jgi:hypothetical protein
MGGPVRVVNEEWAGPDCRARYRAVWDRMLLDGTYRHLNRLLEVQILPRRVFDISSRTYSRLPPGRAFASGASSGTLPTANGRKRRSSTMPRNSPG